MISLALDPKTGPKLNKLLKKEGWWHYESTSNTRETRDYLNRDGKAVYFGPVLDYISSHETTVRKTRTRNRMATR